MKTIIIITEDYVFYKLLELPINGTIKNCRTVQCKSYEELKKDKNLSKYDLVILDGVLSGVASFEIVIHLRNEKKFLAPIYFISEVGVEYFRTKAFEAGITEYFTKPFDPFSVTEKIAQILRKSEKNL